jgi:hypothetical protein
LPVSLISGGAKSGLETKVLTPLVTVLSETSFAVTFFVEQPARLNPAAPTAATPAPFSNWRLDQADDILTRTPSFKTFKTFLKIFLGYEILTVLDVDKM